MGIVYTCASLKYAIRSQKVQRHFSSTALSWHPKIHRLRKLILAGKLWIYMNKTIKGHAGQFIAAYPINMLHLAKFCNRVLILEKEDSLQCLEYYGTNNSFMQPETGSNTKTFPSKTKLFSHP